MLSSVKYLKPAFLASFNTRGSMPGEYQITTEPNIVPVQYGNRRVPKRTIRGERSSAPKDIKLGNDQLGAFSNCFYIITYLP